MRRCFQRHSYVHLPGLISEQSMQILREEIASLENHCISRNFIMPELRTPRVMKVLGGGSLVRESKILWALYSHYQLWRVIEGIVDSRIYPCRHPEEFMVANFLVESGQTHGWHLDDPAYALIIFLEAPEQPSCGGSLEYIQDWQGYCLRNGFDPEKEVETAVARARAAGLVLDRTHRTGEAYLLKADTCLHRVTGLQGEGLRRVALNLGYESRPDTKYGSTASLLYGEP